MAKHARSVMQANGVADIVTVIQGAVEDIVLPAEDDFEAEEDDMTDGSAKGTRVVDIMISEWMGYFLLRESMLDSIIRARDKFLKRRTGLMMPSHTTMYFAPVQDEEERKHSSNDYNASMSDWSEFADTTKTVYGVDMSVLERSFEREQREYYSLSSRWSELEPAAVLSEPKIVKVLDMTTCTLEESKGIFAGDPYSTFDFDVKGDEVVGPISGFAGWFTADFKSRTDEAGIGAPKLPSPAFLSTGPNDGYTHWGQQTFYLLSSIPLLKGETTRLEGSIEMSRSKDNARLYNCRIRHKSSRRKNAEEKEGTVLMKGALVENVYQIP
mmetsp:Transcript_32471/g.43319  ORF Transcript_32471/g.43319 Transcript_32471/m.43319 type:complete len:326 (-) Transcript_32471:218-1195(-)